MFQRPSIFSKPSAMQESAQQAFLRANHLTGSTRSNEPLKMACGATRKAMDSPSRWPRTLLSRRNVDDDFVPIKCRVAFHYTPNKNAAEDSRHYTIAPPQLDPAPAVQPKQWLPVVISRLSILCGSTSHRKIGAPFSHCSPSC